MAMAKSIVLTMTTKPKTAYDVRRYITLVQVLAQDGVAGNVIHLCELWGIEPVLVNVAPAPIDHWATLRKLAQHVIEYHQEDTTI
jgi:hypothetical protein